MVIMRMTTSFSINSSVVVDMSCCSFFFNSFSCCIFHFVMHIKLFCHAVKSNQTIKLYYITWCTKKAPSFLRSDVLTGTIDDRQWEILPETFEITFDGRKRLFDWVQIRRIRRKENEFANNVEETLSFEYLLHRYTYKLHPQQENELLPNGGCCSCLIWGHFEVQGKGWWGESVTNMSMTKGGGTKTYH